MQHAAQCSASAICSTLELGGESACCLLISPLKRARSLRDRTITRGKGTKPGVLQGTALEYEEDQTYKQCEG